MKRKQKVYTTLDPSRIHNESGKMTLGYAMDKLNGGSDEWDPKVQDFLNRLERRIQGHISGILGARARGLSTVEIGDHNRIKEILEAVNTEVKIFSTDKKNIIYDDKLVLRIRQPKKTEADMYEMLACLAKLKSESSEAYPELVCFYDCIKEENELAHNTVELESGQGVRC